MGWEQSDFTPMHQTQTKKSVGFHLQWQPFFRVCFLMMFHSRQNFPSASMALSRTSVPSLTLTVSIVEIPGQPSHCKARNIFLQPLTILNERGLWDREGWSELPTDRGNSWPRNGAPAAQPSSMNQTRGYCLLLKPVDISRYLKSDVVSDLTMHTLILKWYNTVQHQGRLLYAQATVNLSYKSILKCFLHRRLIFQNVGMYPLGTQIVPQTFPRGKMK